MKRLIIVFFALLPLMVSAQQSIRSTRIEVTNALDADVDEAARSIVMSYKAGVDSVMAPVLGESLVGMRAGRPESVLSNWAADVLVENSVFDGGQRADLGIINVGGLRSGMPQGTIRRGDILLISPFENRLAVVYLKGADLLSLMQDIAAVRGEGVSHEVQLRITSDGRLLSALISGQEIDPERTYRIATLDYLAEGNDKLYSFKRAQKINVSPMLANEAMMQSIKKAGVITSKMEGRITVEN